MGDGGHAEVLRRLADRLCAEFAVQPSVEVHGAGSDFAEKAGLIGTLSDEDEMLVRRLREALAYIAATLRSETGEPSERAVALTLDGAEFVIRGELETGNAEHVVRLMPSFVFLVGVSAANHDQALKLSERTAELARQAGA